MRKTVSVKPGSRRQEVKEEADGSLVVYLKQRPVDGKANAELVEVLAEHWKVPRSAIRIKMGTTGRKKIVEIDER